jgi:hypothetical protein
MNVKLDANTISPAPIPKHEEQDEGAVALPGRHWVRVGFKYFAQTIYHRSKGAMYLLWNAWAYFAHGHYVGAREKRRLLWMIVLHRY